MILSLLNENTTKRFTNIFYFLDIAESLINLISNKECILQHIIQKVKIVTILTITRPIKQKEKEKDNP
jgi:hypothetical protein